MYEFSNCLFFAIFLILERRRRSGVAVKKEPPARPPPVANTVINTNNLNNNYLDNTDATVTLRNPVQIGESFGIRNFQAFFSFGLAKIFSQSIQNWT